MLRENYPIELPNRTSCHKLKVRVNERYKERQHSESLSFTVSGGLERTRQVTGALRPQTSKIQGGRLMKSVSISHFFFFFFKEG